MSKRAQAPLLWLLLATATVWFTIPGEASSEATIADLEATVEELQVLASFRLENAFGDDFSRRVQSGLPTELVYHLELVRDRRSWFDKNVATSTLVVAAMYNATTDEYLLNFKHDGQLVESRVLRDIDELRKAMTVVQRFPVVSVADREETERLQLRVRAELGTRTVMAFIPRTVQTPWAETDHFRPQNGQQASGATEP